MSSCKERKKPSYHKYDNGFIVPLGDYRPGHLEDSLTYVPKDDDVFIATYPKCGTTWTQYILYLILHEGVPLKSDENIYDFCPHLEDNGKDAVESVPRPRIIKTHLPYELVPKSDKARYIYVARNPKDCCVSFYHHTKGFSKFYNFEDGSFEDYFEVFIEGQVDGGDYFDHFLSWFHRREDSNVLFLLYEDMKKDTKKSIVEIGGFLGGPFAQAVKNESILQAILDYSSISAMKKLSFWDSERPKDSPFIRKGVVGDWRQHFSREQSQRLDEKFKSKLEGTGAEHLWDPYGCLEYNQV